MTCTNWPAQTGNSRNGKRSKAVLTDMGPAKTAVPRDRFGSFEPKIVKKRQKRLAGINEILISLAVKCLTIGEGSPYGGLLRPATPSQAVV